MKRNTRHSDLIKSPVFTTENGVTQMQAYSKKGKEVTAFIDEDDIGRIKNLGKWFAQWDTDHYQILCRTQIDGFPIKMPLGAFILGVGHNAPVHHKNNDLLDFRKGNLAIFEKSDRNIFKLQDHKDVELQLLDRYGRYEASLYLDAADAANLQNSGLIWTYQKKSNGQPLVTAQTDNGPTTMHQYLTDCPDDSYVHFINKNPLDCRRKNMEIKLIAE